MKFRGLIAATIVALLLAVSACSSSSGSGGSTQAGGGGGSSSNGGGGSVDGKTVYVLTLTRSCDTCASFADTSTADLKKAGAKVVTEYVDFGAAAAQTQQFNQALSTHPAAILVWPTDTTSLLPALARAKQQDPKVKIIVAIYPPDTTDTSLYSAYFGIDEKQLGVEQAKSMVAGIKALGKPLQGSVLEITGAPGAATTVLRQQGFEATLPQVAPGLKIVDSQTAKWDETQATTVAAQMFAKYAHNNILGVFAESDVMLNGAILAGTRAGFQAGKSYVAVGIDCDPIGYKNIQGGKEYSTRLWDPYLLGHTGAQVTVDLLEGKTVPKTTSAAAPEISPTNLSACNQAIGKG